MLLYREKNARIDSKAAVDSIEAHIYASLKTRGFRKFSRTLHRFVDENISQIINFQIHADALYVNVGIRVPECSDRTFFPVVDQKYYREEQCTIRARLGETCGRRETRFDLRRNPEKIAAKILQEIEKYVLPAFEVLSTRENILKFRRSYPNLDRMSNHIILLDEVFICGYLGQSECAADKFRRYYQDVVKENEIPQKLYLQKGQTILFNGQKITASKSGFIMISGLKKNHLDYLEHLASKLGIMLS